MDHLLSEQIRVEIVALARQGLSYRAIARIIGQRFNRPSITHGTVSYVWNNYLRFQNLQNHWNLYGRPRILSQRDQRQIIRYVKRNRRVTVQQVIDDLGLNVHRMTVNNVLTQNELMARRARIAILISSINKANRVIFARRMLRMGQDYWDTIIYSDECMFHIFNPSHRTLVRRRPNERMDEANLQYRGGGGSRGGRGFMVWGAISVEGVGPLVRLQGRQTGETYVALLRRELPRHYRNAFNGRGLVFQDDLAPCHRARAVTAWKRRSGLTTLNWVAQSPDLNLIENVWGVIDGRLSGIPFDDEDALWEEVQLQSRRVRREYIEQLYASYERRLRAVIRFRGGPTGY